MRYLAIGVALALSACATSETVYLRNPAGQTAQCGPYTDYGNIPSANLTTQIQLRDCVADYQRQGYERAQAPQ
jgi:hypothetical protein